MHNFQTREQWLNEAVEELNIRVIEPAGYKVRSTVHCSVGWPGGRGGKKAQVIGQCWPHSASADGNGHIFISPVLDNPVDVLAVLLHELGHDIVGCEHGHKKPFATFCRAVGLNKPWTATTPNESLVPVLRELAENTLGPYPHPKLTTIGGTKKQTTRMLKYECPGCGQIVRAANAELRISCVECGQQYEREVKE